MGISSRSNINSQTLFNLFSLVIVNGLSFIVTPYISKLLGTEGYGICSLYVTYVGIISIICGCKISSSLYTARIKFEKRFNNYCSSTFLLGLLSSMIVLIIVFVFRSTISLWINIEVKYIPLIVIQGIAGYIIIFMTSYQINEKKAEMNLLLSFSVMLTTTILSVVLIKVLQGNYEGRILGLAIPNIIIAFVCGVILFKKSKPTVNYEFWKYAIVFSLPIVFQELAGIILNQADRVMLQRIVGFSTTGIYSLGVTFSHVTAIIYQAFNKSWVPFYYEDLHNGNIERIIDRVKSGMFNITLIAIGFLMLSKEVYIIYAPTDYLSGIDIVPILALGCYFQFLYYYPVNHELYKGRTVFVAIGTIGAGIVNIILNSILIPPYGMKGACIATTISNIFLFIFHAVLTKLLYKSDYYIHTSLYIRCIIIISIAYCWYYVCLDYLPLRWTLALICGIAFISRGIKKKGLF